MTVVLVLIGMIAVTSVLCYAGAIKLERRAAMWEEYRHPPDREDDSDEHDGSG